jgi:hypothetical protein
MRLLCLDYKIKGKFIDSGFILANHRTWCDFLYDPYVSGSAIMGIFIAFFAMLFASVLGLIDNRIMVVYNKDSRHTLYTKIARFMNSNSRYSKKVLFYPEGQRNLYTTLTLDETKQIIKPGLLKSIYEDNKYPVQIMMSNNKENIINEKNFKIKIGQTITTELSEPIHPKDYDSFEKFLDKIHNEWFILFNKLY